MAGFIMPRLAATISVFGVILFIIAVSMKLTSITINPATFPLQCWQNSHVFSVEPHLQTKLAHAESLWTQSVEDRKAMMAASGSSKDFPDGYIYPYNVWDFARPSFFCPHDLERVGALGDGGKVVCGMSRYERECPGPSSSQSKAQELVVYSFGVSDDSSFEAALLKRTNAVIWGYDYSVNSWAKDIPEHQASRATFHKFAIGKESNEASDPPFYTIQDLMKANGHSYVDLVKMDIEGAEFDAMTSLVSSIVGENAGADNQTLPFGQLLIEIHLLTGKHPFTVPTDLSSWIKWWEAMEMLGLRPVNNEDNWIGDVGW